MEKFGASNMDKEALTDDPLYGCNENNKQNRNESGKADTVSINSNYKKSEMYESDISCQKFTSENDNILEAHKQRYQNPNLSQNITSLIDYSEENKENSVTQKIVEFQENHNKSDKRNVNLNVCEVNGFYTEFEKMIKICEGKSMVSTTFSHSEQTGKLKDFKRKKLDELLEKDMKRKKLECREKPNVLSKETNSEVNNDSCQIDNSNVDDENNQIDPGANNRVFPKYAKVNNFDMPVMQMKSEQTSDTVKKTIISKDCFNKQINSENKDTAHKCEICQTERKTAANMKLHLKTFHLIGMIKQCAICSQIFAYSESLDRHLTSAAHSQKNSNLKNGQYYKAEERIISDTSSAVKDQNSCDENDRTMIDHEKFPPCSENESTLTNFRNEIKASIDKSYKIKSQIHLVDLSVNQEDILKRNEKLPNFESNVRKNSYHFNLKYGKKYGSRDRKIMTLLENMSNETSHMSDKHKHFSKLAIVNKNLDKGQHKHKIHLEARKDKEYISNSHLKSNFECDICDEHFASQLALSNHNGFCHSVLIYKCKICDLELRGLSELKTHSEIVHLKRKQNDHNGRIIDKNSDSETVMKDATKINSEDFDTNKSESS